VEFGDVFTAVAGIAPDSMKAEMHRKMAEPESGE